MAALVLSADGLGPVSFGTQAARALGALTQALGRAEDSTVLPAEANCEATRIFKWKDLDALVNEVGSRSGGTAGLVGWSMRLAPSSLDLKTDKGVGIGSTLAAIRAAYGEGVSTAQAEGGSTLTIATPNGTLIGEVDGLGDASKVTNLRAGVSCAA